MKYLQLLIIPIAVLFLFSCEDYSADDVSVIGVEIENQVPQDGGSIIVSVVIHCEAEKVVVWSGAEGSDYDTYLSLIESPGTDEANLTVDYPEGEYLENSDLWGGLYAYEVEYPGPGTYTLTIIASSTGDFSEDIKQVIYREIITVD